MKLVGACEEGGKGKERRERKREGEEESEGMSVRGRGEGVRNERGWSEKGEEKARVQTTLASDEVIANERVSLTLWLLVRQSCDILEQSELS